MWPDSLAKSVLRLLLATTFLCLAACSDPPPPAQTETASAQPELPDTPLSDGQCIGWQKSLADGDAWKVYEVYECLLNLARSDREMATTQARVLKSWDIVEKQDNALSVLITTLDRFESDTELGTYLTDIGALGGKGAFEDDDSLPSLVPQSFFEARSRVVWFDAETGMFPNNHDWLLAEIAAKANDLYTARFTEIAPADYDSDDPYTLQADLNGKTYELQAENYGDWYDVGAILTLLNMLSIDQDLDDRFVMLPTGDQTAIIMVIHRSALRTLIDDGLMIKASPDDPMATGKAFEEQVRAAFSLDVD